MTYKSKAALSGMITKVSFFGLLILYTVRFLWLAPSSGEHPWVIWLVHILPLIGFTPYIVKGVPRPHAWLCFVLTLYFLGAVLSAIQPQIAVYGFIEVLLIITLFSAAMMFARWQSRWLREQLES